MDSSGVLAGIVSRFIHGSSGRCLDALDCPGCRLSRCNSLLWILIHRGPCRLVVSGWARRWPASTRGATAEAAQLASRPDVANIARIAVTRPLPSSLPSTRSVLRTLVNTLASSRPRHRLVWRLDRWSRAAAQITQNWYLGIVSCCPKRRMPPRTGQTRKPPR